MGSCGCSGGMKDGRACTCNNCMKKRGYQKRFNSEPNPSDWITDSSKRQKELERLRQLNADEMRMNRRREYVLNPVTGNMIQNTSRNRQSIQRQLKRAEIRMRQRRRQMAAISAQNKKYNHLMWWVPGNVGIVDAKGTIGVDDRVE